MMDKESPQFTSANVHAQDARTDARAARHDRRTTAPPTSGCSGARDGRPVADQQALPIPASPRTSTTAGTPSDATRPAAASRDHSALRPTSVDATGRLMRRIVAPAPLRSQQETRPAKTS
jgi:hypothetical protein